MSRIAKKPIDLPVGVEISQDNIGYIIKGKLGQVIVPYLSSVRLSFEGSSLFLIQESVHKDSSALVGLLRSLLANAVLGVSVGFKKTLELKGLGFRCSLENKLLSMSLGFSHKVLYNVPSDVNVSLEKDTIIHIESVYKDRVGQVASEIRSKKVPDNYHSKGILYRGEIVITKEGKKK